MSRYRKDYAGQRFGRLVAREFVSIHPKSKNAIWRCDCDCGNVVELRAPYFVYGDTASCGCKRSDMMWSARWKGIGEISGSYLTSMRAHAISRNHEYSVTPEYLWGLFLEQNRKCAMSGEDLIFACRSGGKHRSKRR
jgi:hypothetical protein